MCKKRTISFHTALQSLKFFLWILDCEWMGYLLLTSGNIVIEVLRTTKDNIQLGHTQGILGRSNPTVPAEGNLSMFNPTGGMNTTGKRVSLAAGNRSRSSSNAEVGSSQVYRQEMVNQAARKHGQKDLTRPKSEEDSHSTGQPVAVLWDLENVKFFNYPYIEKIFQCIQKKLGRTWRNAAFSVGFLLEQRIGMVNLHDTVDEGSHPPWARFLGELRSIQAHKIREHFSKRRILNVKTLDYHSPSWTRSALFNDNVINRAKAKVCLCRFSSTCGKNRTESRSRRCKMDRTNWRSQQVSFVRRSGSWRRSNWSRVGNSPRFTTLTIFKEIQMDLWEEEHGAWELQKTDHLCVCV